MTPWPSELWHLWMTSVESEHLFTQGHIPMQEQETQLRNELAQTVLLTAQDFTGALCRLASHYFSLILLL